MDFTYSEPMKEFIRKKVADLQSTLRLDEYEIKVEYSNREENGDANVDVMMRIVVDPVYLKAVITILPPSDKEWWGPDGRKAVAMLLLHEMCHVFVEPITRFFMWDVPTSQKGFAQDTIERQVCRLVNGFANAMPSGWWV